MLSHCFRFHVWFGFEEGVQRIHVVEGKQHSGDVFLQDEGLRHSARTYVVADREGVYFGRLPRSNFLSAST